MSSNINTSTNINLITNIIAVLITVLTAANSYLQTRAGAEVDYFQLIVAVGLALVSYFTGKEPVKESTKEAKTTPKLGDRKADR